MVFDYLDYRHFIRHWVDKKKAAGLKVSYHVLADAIKIQKTYLSKVLAGGANINQDQAFLLSEFLTLTKEERQYFFLLVEKERTGLKDRKKAIQDQLRDLRIVHLQTDKRVKGLIADKVKQKDKEKKLLNEALFLNSFNQLVHVALTIERFRKKPSLLAEALRISQEELRTILTKLESEGLIKIDKEIKVLKESIHIKRESDYFWPWYQQATTASREIARLNNNPEDLNFSVSFSADEDTVANIKQNFLDFLENAQTKVIDAKCKTLYQMNFDLINWRI